MEVKFECPDCRQHISATQSQVGQSGMCPGCGRTVIVPSFATLSPPVPVASPVRPAQVVAARRRSKGAEDYAADAICATAGAAKYAATGAAKGAWKATKVVAPVLGRIVGKVAGRAATAAAPHVEKATMKTLNAIKPPDAGSAVKLIIGKLLGWW